MIGSLLDTVTNEKNPVIKFVAVVQSKFDWVGKSLIIGLTEFRMSFLSGLVV